MQLLPLLWVSCSWLLLESQNSERHRCWLEGELCMSDAAICSPARTKATQRRREEQVLRAGMLCSSLLPGHFAFASFGRPEVPAVSVVKPHQLPSWAFWERGSHRAAGFRESFCPAVFWLIWLQWVVIFSMLLLWVLAVLFSSAFLWYFF